VVIILPRSESNFTHSHLDFQKIFPGTNPRTLAYRGREGLGELLPLKEVQRERKGEGR